MGEGPGHAELTFGDETDLQSESFDAESLAGDPFADLEHSEVLGLGFTAPEVAAEGEAAGTGGLEASQGEAAWRRRLSPGQRAAVRRFFSSDSDSDG
ncbi:MAG: hypothetical protein P1V81_00485 [Planctomycetota bacterium]|nr:hypothetical protein [Planctomycetota bacterium]